MGRRGTKPHRTEVPAWTPELAYACGLIASDGCLYSDGRHISLTSSDIDQLETFKKCLGLKNKISYKPSGKIGQQGAQVQFGDVTLYHWLESIGITARKTFTIGVIDVPDIFFVDYLRGEFDGDGSSHAYWDTRWHSSVSLYLNFTCASITHLQWINAKIRELIGATGLVRQYGKNVPNLRFAKTQSRKIYEAMYYESSLPFLQRKKDKLDRQWTALAQSKEGITPVGFHRKGSIIVIT